MTDAAPEQWLAERLQAAGMDPAVPIEYGARPLIAHADDVSQPAQAWLEQLGGVCPDPARHSPRVLVTHSFLRALPGGRRRRSA